MMKNPLLYKLLIVMFVTLLSTHTLLSQNIYNGDLTLSTQTEVDAFNYTEIYGDLTISGSDITDLTPLNSLTSVGGRLIINDNTSLTSLSGLDNLTSVGGNLSIESNNSLTSFCGLYPLIISGGLAGDYNVNDNALNPTRQEIFDGGPCITRPYSEYLFEEPSGTTVFDSHKSNDGAIMNTISRVDGVQGRGLEFTGDGYISFGQVFGDNVQSEVTLSAWIKPSPSSTGGDYQGVIMHGGPNTDTYALYVRPDTREIAFKTNGTSNAFYTISGVNTLWDGDWHLLTVTYDGYEKVIYLDDDVLTSVDATGTIDSGEGYNLLIGAGRDEESPTLLYEGLIDEVRIYKYSLTIDENIKLYNRVNLPPPENLTGTNKKAGFLYTSFYDGYYFILINLNWSTPDSETPPTGYNVYYSESEEGPFSSVFTTETNYDFEINYDHDVPELPLPEDDSWWFYVTAVYDTGESVPTEIISVIPDAPILTLDGPTTTTDLEGVSDNGYEYYTDANWYKFYAPPISVGENKSYQLEATGADMKMWLYEGDMSTLIEKDTHTTPYRAAQIWLSNTTGGWYYVIVYATTPCNYTIGVKTINDLPYRNLIVDWPLSATYDITTDIVEYRFTTGIAGDYTVQTNGSLNTVLSLYDSTGLIEQDDDDGEDANAMIQRELAANTTYIVRMTAPTNGGYSIVIKGPAMELVVNDPCYSSSVVYASETDWYKFKTGSAGIYTIEQSVNSKLIVSLYEIDKTTLITADGISNEAMQQRIDWDLVADTWYYISLRDVTYRAPSVVNDSYCIGVSHLVDMSPTYSEYLFEEPSGTTVFDSHDSNDGTIINNAARVNGVQGGGLEFTGDGYISLGQVFGENVQEEVTLSAWIKSSPSSAGGEYQGVIMHGGPDTDTYGLYVRPDTREIAFKTSGTSNAFYSISDVNTLWDGDWHLLTVTYDGTSKVIYLDKDVLGEIDASGSIQLGAGYNLLIGAGRDELTPTLLYEGIIDEVRIYNYALTNDQIVDLYNSINPTCPQHFHAIWEGTFGQDHMNIHVTEARFDGVDLSPGDEIGVFDGDICVGYGKVEQTINMQNILSITVSCNDGSANGFIPGNDISYVIWNCDEKIELKPISTTYYNNQLEPLPSQRFDQGASVFVALNGVSEICLTLDFNVGWNLFSIANKSENPDIQNIFQTIIDNNSLVKIQDEAGNSLEDWGIFGGWQNNIGDITPTEGYKTKLNATASSEICGIPVEYPFPIPLRKGWNIMGYPQTANYSAMDVVQQLVDNGTLVKVQDQKGNSIEDWGIFGGWQNNIGEFTQGEGYKINLSTDDTLWIYESYPKSSIIFPKLVTTAHFLPEFEGNGVDHMNINLVELPQNYMEVGDELAVFDGSTCVGAVTLLPEHIASHTISISTSATDNEGMPGFVEGNMFILKLYKTQLHQEFDLLPEIVTGPAIFTKHETAVVSLKKYAVTGLDVTRSDGVNNVNCYPNPFSNYLTVEISMENQAKVDVVVVNLLGQIVRVLAKDQVFSPGINSVIWDGFIVGNKQAAPGIYHVRVKFYGYYIIKKIVLTK